MFKRIVSFFLCFVTVLCSFSVTAFADIFDAVRYNLNSLSEFIENLDVHVGTDGAFVEGELGFSAVKWWSALVMLRFSVVYMTIWMVLPGKQSNAIRWERSGSVFLA